MDKAHPERPVTLPLLSLRLPLAAWVSFLHRLSGVLLFFFLPPALYLLEQSLRGPASFAQVQQQLMQPWARVALLIAAGALAHHLLAGLRHLLLDLHIGASLAEARRSARWVMAGSAVAVLLFAWRLFA